MLQFVILQTKYMKIVTICDSKKNTGGSAVQKSHYFQGNSFIGCTAQGTA